MALSEEATVRRWAARLGTENSQYAAHGMPAYLLRTRLGEASSATRIWCRPRQQQALAGAENHRSKVAGAIDDMTQSALIPIAKTAGTSGITGRQKAPSQRRKR